MLCGRVGGGPAGLVEDRLALPQIDEPVPFIGLHDIVQEKAGKTLWAAAQGQVADQFQFAWEEKHLGHFCNGDNWDLTGG